MTETLLPESPLRAVTFDLDGLMFNTEELYQEVVRTLLARRNKPCSGRLLDKMMGRQAQIALQIMLDWHDLSDKVEAIAVESQEIMLQLLSSRLAPMPGMMELLNALETAGLPKAVATSSGKVFTASVLQKFQLEPRFSFVLTGDDIEQSKPAPDVYLLAAEKHGVRPEEMLVLEDSQVGCQAGVAAGAYTVAVPDGRSHAHDFAGTRFIAKSLADERIYQVLHLLKA